MSAFKIFAAPWSAVANSWQHTTVYDANQVPVCRLDLDDWGVDESNQTELERLQSDVARKLAAAPDLLEALQRLAKLIPVAADCRTGRNVVEFSDDEWAELCGVTPVVHAAIAKATGSS